MCVDNFILEGGGERLEKWPTIFSDKQFKKAI